MNWICVLEQAVCGTGAIGIIALSLLGLVKVGFYAYDNFPRYRRVVTMPVVTMPIEFHESLEITAKWILKPMAYTVGALGVLAMLCVLYADFVIPLGKSILNVAMGRECW